MTNRFRVDFHTANADAEGRVYLPSHTHPEHGDILQPGQSIVMYTPHDIEVEAIVEYDNEHLHWYGRADWSTQRDLASENLRNYWEVASKIRQWRDEDDTDSTKEAILKVQAVDIWSKLLDDERSWLRDGGYYYVPPEPHES